MQRLKEVLPNVIGAAQLVSGEGGWETVNVVGDLEVRWALSVLRTGESRLYSDVDEASEEVEAVMTSRQGVHVVVADARGAMVLRLEHGTNLGLALGYAHGVVRGGAP